jgi:ElaB/YqjD/DUF883 family membrane-anchored ribosome-binding protein
VRTETIENGASTGVKFAHMAAKAAEGKILAEDLVEIGKRKAERLVRRGREVGEDYLDDATHHIKHHPWQAVGIAAGVGAIVGLLFGLSCSRACNK